MGLSVIIARSIAVPIRQLAGNMCQLANNDTNIEIAGVKRSDAAMAATAGGEASALDDHAAEQPLGDARGGAIELAADAAAAAAAAAAVPLGEEASALNGRKAEELVGDAGGRSAL